MYNLIISPVISIGGSFEVVDSYLPRSLSREGERIVDPRNHTANVRRDDTVENVSQIGVRLRIIGPVSNEFKWNIAVGAVP